jgi:hypothetical protein
VRYVGAATGNLWRKYMNPLQLRKAESTLFEGFEADAGNVGFHSSCHVVTDHYSDIKCSPDSKFST